MDLNHKMEEAKPIEKAVFSFTDNKIIGAAYYLAMIGFVFMRRDIGVRMLKVEMVCFTASFLMVFAAMADWITRLPLIRARMDFGSFKIFVIAYVVMSFIHIIKAYLDSRQIPFTFTRSMGSSRIESFVFSLNLPFIRQSQTRLQAFVEPLVMVVIAHVVFYTIAPNLGKLLLIVAVCMFVIGIVVIQNEDEIRYNQNDSMLLAEHTKQNMEGVGNRSAGVRGNGVSKAARPEKRATAE